MVEPCDPLDRRLGRAVLDRQRQLQRLGDALERELDLAEQLVGVGQRVADDDAVVVRVEQALVQLENLEQRRKPELARLQDQVARVEVANEVALLLVHHEAGLGSVLVDDPVEVVEAPLERAPLRPEDVLERQLLRASHDLGLGLGCVEHFAHASSVAGGASSRSRSLPSAYIWSGVISIVTSLLSSHGALLRTVSHTLPALSRLTFR
jgi:hypothetical protein